MKLRHGVSSSLLYFCPTGSKYTNRHHIFQHPLCLFFPCAERPSFTPIWTNVTFRTRSALDQKNHVAEFRKNEQHVGNTFCWVEERVHSFLESQNKVAILLFINGTHDAGDLFDVCVKLQDLLRSHTRENIVGLQFLRQGLIMAISSVVEPPI